MHNIEPSIQVIMWGKQHSVCHNKMTTTSSSSTVWALVAAVAVHYYTDCARRQSLVAEGLASLVASSPLQVDIISTWNQAGRQLRRQLRYLITTACWLTTVTAAHQRCLPHEIMHSYLIKYFDEWNTNRKWHVIYRMAPIKIILINIWGLFIVRFTNGLIVIKGHLADNSDNVISKFNILEK